MQRSTFDPQDASWNPLAETLRATERESEQEIERWPTPGELFFETGVVLAVALSADAVVQLIMGTG